MTERRKYKILPIRVNGIRVNEVVIDPHYESKHQDLSDKLILRLIRGLNNRFEIPDSELDSF